MMDLIITILKFCIISLSFCSSSGEVTGEILEHPRNQYVLENTTVQMHCKTRGVQTFWLLNNEVISIHGAKSKYEALGFTFIEDHDLGYINLTLTVVTTEQINNTRVECEATSSNHRDVAYSNVAHLIVLTSFRPHSPQLDVSSLLHDSTPYLSITLTAGQPLWPGYTISAFILSIINISSRVVLREINITVPDSAFNMEIHLNQSLPQTVTYDCSQLLIAASAFSMNYGISKLSVTDLSIPKSPGQFIINYMVLLYPSGEPYILLDIHLPGVCSFQFVNYTINLEDTSVGLVSLIGPFTHQGTGRIFHPINDGLTRETEYSVWVNVDSNFGSSTSDKYHFMINNTEQTGSHISNSDDSYKIATGICLTLTITVLPFLVIFLCLFVYNRRQRNKRKIFSESASRVCNNLMNNPIYDGPVYDSIHPQFENLNTLKLQEEVESTYNNDTLAQSQDHHQAFAPNTLDNDAHIKDTVRYLDQPLCLSSSHSLYSQNGRNGNLHDGSSQATSSTSAQTSTITGFVNPVALSDEYTVMQAPATLKESLNGGWDES